jgi:hypothetical protein
MKNPDEEFRLAIDETIRFRRRCVEQLQNRQAQPVPGIPQICLRPVEMCRDINMASPSPTTRAFVCTGESERVGEIEFAVSPLLDCVFVQRVWVAPEFRRRKIGTAALKTLSHWYGGLPLIITHEKLGAHAFWSHVYRLTPWIPILDPVQETDGLHRARFAHLFPVFEGWMRDRAGRGAPGGWVPIVAEGCRPE